MSICYVGKILLVTERVEPKVSHGRLLHYDFSLKIFA